MKLGAEPKKIAILGGLLVVALVVFYMNSSSTGEQSSSRSSTAPAATKGPAQTAAVTPAAPTRPANRNDREFRPSVKPKRGEAPPDPTSIDPTLRLDILAKLQQVNVDGVHRSVFDFGQAPPPPAPKPTIAKAKIPSPFGPEPPPAKPVASNTPPPTPQAPPIPMKFFGYISPSSQPGKRAFFIEGEDIHVVREGDVVRNRYKIVRIGINSVIVEDLQFKSQQTLPLEEQSS